MGLRHGGVILSREGRSRRLQKTAYKRGVVKAEGKERKARLRGWILLFSPADQWFCKSDFTVTSQRGKRGGLDLDGWQWHLPSSANALLRDMCV